MTNRYTAAQQIEWLSILQTAVHDYALAMRRAAAFGAMLAECDLTTELLENPESPKRLAEIHPKP